MGSAGTPAARATGGRGSRLEAGGAGLRGAPSGWQRRRQQVEVPRRLLCGRGSGGTAKREPGTGARRSPPRGPAPGPDTCRWQRVRPGWGGAGAPDSALVWGTRAGGRKGTGRGSRTAFHPVRSADGSRSLSPGERRGHATGDRRADAGVAQRYAGAPPSPPGGGSSHRGRAGLEPRRCRPGDAGPCRRDGGQGPRLLLLLFRQASERRGLDAAGRVSMRMNDRSRPDPRCRDPGTGRAGR